MADSRRSRSPEPSRERRQRDDRDRRDRPRNSHRSGGFKWKERRDTTDEREGGEKRLERGYRRRSRSPQRDREREKTGSSDKYGIADKFGTSTKDKDKDKEKAKEDTSAPPERAPAASTQPVGEPMIIVHVNDRLGTKAGIPCLASDTIGDFKKIVAMQIGRKPHEIMLKRQGQRPFKDQITLADYEISNGVQLDLEVDTGE